MFYPAWLYVRVTESPTTVTTPTVSTVSTVTTSPETTGTFVIAFQALLVLCHFAISAVVVSAGKFPVETTVLVDGDLFAIALLSYTMTKKHLQLYKPFSSTYPCVYHRQYDYRNSYNDHHADSQHCNDDCYDRNYR